MTPNLVLAACAVLLVVLFVVLRLRRRGADAAEDRLDTLAAWPPSSIRILSSRERDAFAILRNALPEHTVFAQVPLARFLKVPKRHSYTEWMRRLGHQCADLVVCDAATEVIAVVDIQPPVSDQSDRSQRRHQRVARALEAAGIRHVVWTENALPSVSAARAQLLPRTAEAAPLAGTRPTPATAMVTTAAAAAPSPFEDDARDSSHDERIELREPPPSTWFDEFDTAPTPLSPDKAD